MSMRGFAGSWHVQPLSVGHAGKSPVPPPTEPPLPAVAALPPDALIPADAVIPAVPVDAGLPAVPVDAGVPAVAVIAGVPAEPLDADAAAPVVPVVPVPGVPVVPVIPDVEAPVAAVGCGAALPAVDEPLPEGVVIGGPGATSVTAGFAHPTALASVTLPSTSNVLKLVIVNNTPF
jgi:hypothetical protein